MEHEIELEIKADSSELDEAIDKAEALSEALTIPSVVIRAPKNCTFNIYVTREDR